MRQIPPNSLLSLANAFASAETPRQGLGLTPPPLAAGLASLGVSSDAPKWIYVSKRFQTFVANLELTTLQEADGWTKIYGVVSCLNSAYYGHNSKTDNAFLIGSWAKGTQVRPPRDVDLYFLLPIAVFERFAAYSQHVNKQSALLQEVKSKLLVTYHNSDIKGDGPVVLAGFDSYNIEIVPAFLVSNDERSYHVCDTKNGGKYKKTMPLHEVDVISAADAKNANNVRRLIRMLKAWQSSCSVPIQSFYLELLATEFLDQCNWRMNGYFYYDWISRDFFQWMITKANTYLRAPGTNEMLWLGDTWKSRAESAHARAVKACDYEFSNDMINAGDEW